MAIVDERGRLFGRWNLLDLAVVVLLVGLIPLSYAAYALFRERPPRLLSVEPSSVVLAPEVTLQIKGENLRPYMRISAGTLQARDFRFKSTEEAEVPLTGLAPGTYDIVLFDQAQERFRLRDALTVTPLGLPSTEIVAVGVFGNLDAASAAKLVAGAELPGAGEIVAVDAPVPDRTDIFSGARLITVARPDALQLPAVIKFRCHIRAQQGTPYCVSEDITIAPKAILSLETPAGTLPFQIQRVRSAQPMVSARVSLRVTGHPSVLTQIRTGDADRGGLDSALGELARVERVGAVRGGSDGAAVVDVELNANLQQNDGGWVYDSLPARLGVPLTFRTARYEVTGVITAIEARK